jgi:hypothetical protein
MDINDYSISSKDALDLFLRKPFRTLFIDVSDSYSMNGSVQWISETNLKFEGIFKYLVDVSYEPCGVVTIILFDEDGNNVCRKLIEEYHDSPEDDFLNGIDIKLIKGGRREIESTLGCFLSDHLQMRSVERRLIISHLTKWILHYLR